MYIGDTYFNLKNLSKNRRRELRELKRLYDEAVTHGLKPKSPFGKYTRDDARGRVTKQQLDKLQKISYKTLFESLTIREQLNDRGLAQNRDYKKPSYKDPLRHHPEIDVIAGGQLLDRESGEIYTDWEDYKRKQEQELQAFKDAIEKAQKEQARDDTGYEWVSDQSDDSAPDRGGNYDGGDRVNADEGDAIKVDNFVEAVSPDYVGKNASKGIKDAADLASTIREVEHQYGTKAAAQLIDNIPSDIMGKIQNSSSKERYEADQAALEFTYDFLFGHTYSSIDEEWNE